MSRYLGDSLLLLIHGALSDELMWRPHIRLLQGTLETIAITLSHFDSVENTRFGVRSHASEIVDFLRVLPRNKDVHLAGWSYGADVILEVLGKRPANLKTAFLYEPGTPVLLGHSLFSGWRTDAEVVFGPVRQWVNEGRLGKAAELMVDSTFGEPGFFRRQSLELQEYWLSKAYSLRRQVALEEISELNVARIAGKGEGVSVCYGALTRPMFRLSSEGIYAAMPEAHLRVVPGRGHMLPVEDPQEFVEYILCHLRGGSCPGVVGHTRSIITGTGRQTVLQTGE